MKEIIAVEEMDITRNSDGYEELLAGIRKEFEKHTAGDDAGPLFKTDAYGLYDVFLEQIPAEARQHYNCNACRHFVNRFGGLVRLNECGKQYPVMWSGKVPDFFADAVEAVREMVKKAKVVGVFVTSEAVLGTPVTGSWTHMAVEMPRVMLYRGTTLHTASQAAAEKNEDRRLLRDAVRKYRIETVETAVNLLRSENLYRSEKVLGVAEWFLKVLQMTRRNRRASNILWYFAANAPVGFCHISSSMIGTLLDDIEAGYDFDTVKRKFDEKMNPLQYQRPQAAPSAGNVAQAEKIVEKLGIRNSLSRRFARLDELETLWKPSYGRNTPKAGGVFANVATKESMRMPGAGVSGPAVTMTWEKFQRTVLPVARRIEFYVNGGRDNFSAILTANDLSAPPILQWDREGDRNPFSWYVYHGGSYPSQWGLMNGHVDVTAVVLQPNMWREGYEHNGKAVFFILKGAKDNGNVGLALFPEIMKAELREIRSTIEAYSRTMKLDGYDEASACGIRLQGGSQWNARFKVTTDVGMTTYVLDRWD